jgi:hypothetical protein
MTTETMSIAQSSPAVGVDMIGVSVGEAAAELRRRHAPTREDGRAESAHPAKPERQSASTK